MLIILLHRVARRRYKICFIPERKGGKGVWCEEKKKNQKNNTCFARWLIQGPQKDSGRPKLENKQKKSHWQ